MLSNATHNNQGQAASSPRLSKKIDFRKAVDGKPSKSNARKISDMGIALDSKESEDSFEKYFSKELDLDESEIPIVLHELNDSALNYIARECFDKALVLL